MNIISNYLDNCNHDDDKNNSYVIQYCCCSRGRRVPKTALCEEYCCGRVLAFLQALIDYLKEHPTKSPIKVDITTKGGSGNNKVQISLSKDDKIVDGILYTKAQEGNPPNDVYVTVCNIKEISFQKEKVFINEPILTPSAADSNIIVSVPDVAPPSECLLGIRAVLESSLVRTDGVVTSVKPFAKIDFYNFDLENAKVLSIAQGMATFNGPGNSSVFAPYCSINSLEMKKTQES